MGQLLNYSDIAKNVGVDTTTIQSWFLLLEENGILCILQPYHSNFNQRLIKTPKIYFEDTSLAVRLQGWTELNPMWMSPYFGSLLENLALSEVSRFFINNNDEAEIFFLRSKDQVEVDFLIRLPNERYIGAEVKSTPTEFTKQQLSLLDSLQINIVDRWVITLIPADLTQLSNCRIVPLGQIFDKLRDAVEGR